MSKEDALEITDQIAQQQRGQVFSRLVEAGFPPLVIANMMGVSEPEVRKSISLHVHIKQEPPEDKELAQAYKNLEQLAIQKATYMLQTAPPILQAQLVRAILGGVGRRVGGEEIGDSVGKNEFEEAILGMQQGIPKADSI